MVGRSEIRERISRDLATLGQNSHPKSISEIAEDYLAGDPALDRKVIEKMIMDEALKRKLPIH